MTSLLYAAGGLLLAGVTTAAQYEEYILAPSSRTILPFSVYKVNGTVANADNLLENVAGSATFTDPSSVTLDFGKEIAGFVTFEVSSTDSDQHIGLAYTESSLWISGKGSDATADAGLDQILWFSPTGPGNYTVAPEHDRGGFRYLSLIHNTTGSISVEQVSVHFSAMPDVDENSLKNYSGYFHCDDELLNRVWYAGAYTNQLCTVSTTQRVGRVLELILTDDRSTHIEATRLCIWASSIPTCRETARHRIHGTIITPSRMVPRLWLMVLNVTDSSGLATWLSLCLPWQSHTTSWYP